MNRAEKAGRELATLIGIIARLRGPGGCPWDRRQTVESLTDYLLEEVYEAVEACLSGDAGSAKEELGDVFMEIVLLCRLFEEKGYFSAADALERVNFKMIDRHPHVFAGRKVRGAEQVLKNWNKGKLKEKERNSVLDGLSGNMPALLEAFEIGRKVSVVGFDWRRPEGVLKKIGEELGELKAAMSEKNKRKISEEAGDLLFTAANAARHLGVNPEVVLRRANRRFSSRFRKVEQELAKRGKSAGKANIREMDRIWEKVKKR